MKKLLYMCEDPNYFGMPVLARVFFIFSAYYVNRITIIAGERAAHQSARQLPPAQQNGPPGCTIRARTVLCSFALYYALFQPQSPDFIFGRDLKTS